MIQEHDIHLGGNVRRPRDGIGSPIHAGHVAAVEHHFFHQAAAHGLDQVRFDRGPQRVRIDDQSAIVRAHEAFHVHGAGSPIDFHFCDRAHEGSVARAESDPAAGRDFSGSGIFLWRRAAVPPGFLRGRGQNGFGPRLIQIF